MAIKGMDMLKLYVTTRTGKRIAIESEPRRSVMEVMRHENIDEVLALCGGCRSCGTCHVHIDPAMMGSMPPMSSDEDELLEKSLHRTPYSRLSCQIPFNEKVDGLRLTIAQEGSK